MKRYRNIGITVNDTEKPDDNAEKTDDDEKSIKDAG
jgi:hypothetical protein